MNKSPGDALSADEIRALPTKGWAVSGVLLQSRPGYDLGRLGDIDEAEAADLRATLAERVADGSLKVTFLENWDNGRTYRVHHISGETLKGTFDIEGT